MKSVLKCLSFVLLMAAVLPATAEARNCVKGKACGNSCISQKDVCHVGAGQATAEPKTKSSGWFSGRKSRETTSGATTSAAEAPAINQSAPVPTQPAAAAPAPTTAAPTSAVAPPAKVRQCKKGKACGNSCIPMKAVCHA